MTGFRFAPSLESLDERLNLSPVVPLLAGGDAPDASHVRHQMFAIVDRTQVAESAHPGGVNVLMADGSVRIVGDNFYGKGILTSTDSARSADTSAVVFVGGWGSSMYQY